MPLSTANTWACSRLLSKVPLRSGDTLMSTHNKRTGSVTGPVTGLCDCNGYRGHYRAGYKGVCPVMHYRACKKSRKFKSRKFKHSMQRDAGRSRQRIAYIHTNCCTNTHPPYTKQATDKEVSLCSSTQKHTDWCKWESHSAGGVRTTVLVGTTDGAQAAVKYSDEM